MAIEVVKRISAPLSDGRVANGYDGAEVLEVLEVAAPRMDPLPVGARINLVTRG